MILTWKLCVCCWYACSNGIKKFLIGMTYVDSLRSNSVFFFFSMVVIIITAASFWWTQKSWNVINNYNYRYRDKTVYLCVTDFAQSVLWGDDSLQLLLFIISTELLHSIIINRFILYIHWLHKNLERDFYTRL